MDTKREIIVTQIAKNCIANSERRTTLQEITKNHGLSEKQVISTVNWLISKNIPISIKENEIYIKGDIFDFLFSLVKNLGFSLSSIVKYLPWNDFERYISEALQNFDFQTTLNFRFSVDKKRREIDIVARRDNVVLCIDAKHWTHRIAQSALLRFVEKQKERCNLLIKKPYELLKIFKDLQYYNKVDIIPVIVELYNSKTNFINGVYVIPWLAINEFLATFEDTDQDLWKATIYPRRYKLI